MKSAIFALILLFGTETLAHHIPQGAQGYSTIICKTVEDISQYVEFKEGDDISELTCLSSQEPIPLFFVRYIKTLIEGNTKQPVEIYEVVFGPLGMIGYVATDAAPVKKIAI